MLSRRQLLDRTCLGFGSIVLADLLRGASLSIHNDLKARPTHFPAKAKAVIQLVQNGGPSQMDLFDPKPELTRRAGQPQTCPGLARVIAALALASLLSAAV